MKYITELFLSLVTLFSPAVYAIDTYNHVNNQLTIPAVVLGDTIYRDVVITVGPILTVGGSNQDPKYVPKPSTTFDSYDPYKNQLTIPNVTAYGFIYYDVVINVGTVLSVGSSSPVQVDPIKPWSLTTLSNAGSVLSNAVGCGSYDIVTKGDLNNDGHDDFLLGPKAKYDPSKGCNDSGFTKPIVAYYDPESKTFKLNSATQAAMPEMQWTQAAVIADFNNDGFADMFAVGTGTDYGQPCGEAPILLLGSKNGMVNMSHLLPRFSGYSHQATWGDYNNDGKTDFVILNNNWVPTETNDPRHASCSYRKYPGTNESYVILSSENSWTYSPLRVQDKLGKPIIDGNQSFNSVASGDINNDGKTDLMVLGNEWGSLSQKTITLMGTGTGQFTYVSEFSETPFGDKSVGVNASLRQLDNNGPLELLVNYTEHPGGQAMPFQKSIYRIFSFNTSTSSWANVTEQYITNKTSTENDLTYCSRLYWVDLNSDGKEDFVCTTINPFTSDDPVSASPRMWVKTNSNKFEPAYYNGISLTRKMASPTPVKVDGKVKIVGLRNNYFRSTIQFDLAQ